MVLLGWKKRDFTEVMLYAEPNRDTQKFSKWRGMARALNAKRTACTKVWGPDHGAFEEL